MAGTRYKHDPEYATDERLALRIRTHQRYTQPQVDWAEWVLAHVAAFRPKGRPLLVLDVGCGSGLYLEPVCDRLTSDDHLWSLDLSLGMLRDLASRSLPENITLVNADVLSLPLPDTCYDVVLANHMLYEIEPIDRALVEIKRVLRPGGCLVAATNSRHSMQAFFSEMMAASRALGYAIEIPPAPAQTRFTLENGRSWLAPHFPRLERHVLKSCLVFPIANLAANLAAKPAVAYVNSLQNAYGPRLPQGLSWEALIERVASQIAAKIAMQGAYRVPKTVGAFVAFKGNAV